MTATLEAPARADATAGADTVEPPEIARPVPAALAPWHDPHPVVGWVLTALVALLAAVTRLWAIGYPHGKNFDEVYYATEAKELLRYGYEDNRGYMFIVHPPLGKWLIAVTSHFWHGPQHLDSIGWRVAPAVAGIVSVVVLTRIVRRMLRSNLFGAIAGLLLAMDGLSLVLSRTALLDIFLQTFILAGFGALVVDRDRVRARLAALIADGADLTAGAPTLGPRPWRLLAGVMFGAACAVKWSALSFFVAFVVLSLVWDRAALRSAGVQRPTRNVLRRSVLPASGSLLATPVGVYLLSYLGWFIGENSWGRHYADTKDTATRLNLPLGLHVPFNWSWVPGPIRSLGSYTLQAYRFHEGLDSGHPYKSSQWSWLVLGRPVDFSYDGSSTACGSSTCSREILLIGTPLMWWAFVPALLWLAWHWFTTRDWRAGAVWVAFIAGWAVWFPDAKRTKFLFYMAPLVPFLIIALTLGLGVMLGPGTRHTAAAGEQPDPDPSDDEQGGLSGAPAPGVSVARLRGISAAWARVPAQAHSRRRQWGLFGVCAFLGLVVADFIWMWPIFTGGLLTYDTWHAHMWLPSWV